MSGIASKFMFHLGQVFDETTGELRHKAFIRDETLVSREDLEDKELLMNPQFTSASVQKDRWLSGAKKQTTFIWAIKGVHMGDDGNVTYDEPRLFPFEAN